MHVTAARRIVLLVLLGVLTGVAGGRSGVALATISCGTPLGQLVANGDFETPALDLSQGSLPWPDGTGWTASDTSSVRMISPYGTDTSQSVVMSGGTLSQVLDTTNLAGAVLTISLDTATGGFITVGSSGTAQSMGWHAGSWGTFSTTYLVGNGETSVPIVFSLGDRSNGDQVDIDNVSVTYAFPCPTPTPTDTPTSTPTETPTDTPVSTSTASATIAVTATATTVAATTTAPAATSTAAPTGNLDLTVVTSDGAAIPAGASICVADQCRVAGASLSAAAASGSTFSFTGLAAGAQPVTITGAAPYGDLSTTADIVSGSTATLTVTLVAAIPTELGNATPISTLTVAPTGAASQPTAASGGGGATGGSTTAGGPAVKALPNTGTSGDSRDANANGTLLLVLALALTLGTAAIAWRRRYR